VQLSYGPRIPLLIFGGPAKPGIDSRWCGHASIPKPVGSVVLRSGATLPPPDDAPLPQQPSPPTQV
jgi:hypothetical protein